MHATLFGHVHYVQARAGPDGPKLTDDLWAQTLWAELKGLLLLLFIYL